MSLQIGKKNKFLLFAGYNLCSDGVASLGHYNGTISVTESGADCLNWSEFPDYMQQYPSRGLGDHNYCRNPEGGRTPWCFYRQPSGIISWAHCDCSHGTGYLKYMHSRIANETFLYRECARLKLIFAHFFGTYCMLFF